MASKINVMDSQMFDSSFKKNFILRHGSSGRVIFFIQKMKAIAKSPVLLNSVRNANDSWMC